MKKKIELKVDYEAFCNWYFDDITADSVITDLINDGVVSIQCIADKVYYIPLRLVKNPEAVKGEDLEDSELYGTDEDFVENAEICAKDRYSVVLVRK